jgi:hypothetical protein
MHVAPAPQMTDMESAFPSPSPGSTLHGSETWDYDTAAGRLTRPGRLTSRHRLANTVATLNPRCLYLEPWLSNRCIGVQLADEPLAASAQIDAGTSGGAATRRPPCTASRR